MSFKTNPRHAVYAGSFDPITLGHRDIIARGSRLFERLTVGVGINPGKTPMFTPLERVEIIQHVLKSYPNVDVQCFDGLTVNFVKQCGAGVMLRGLRTLTDIESEFTMTLANRAMAPDIETVFLMASEKYSHISSSLVKQITLLDTDAEGEPLDAFLPKEVIGPLRVKFPKPEAQGGT